MRGDLLAARGAKAGEPATASKRKRITSWSSLRRVGVAELCPPTNLR
jgi:hypothetical protein